MSDVEKAVKAARAVLGLSVREGDQVLIIGTSNMDSEVHEGLAIAAAELGAEATIAIAAAGTSFEMPRPVARALDGADIAIIAAARVSSFAQTEETRAFVEKGGRVISMPMAPGPGKALEFLLRAGQWDREKLLTLREMTLDVARRVQGKRRVRVTSDMGTDLTVSVEGKRWHTMYGIADRDDDSAWGPEEEKLALAPWDDSFAVGTTGFPPAELHNPAVQDTAEGVVFIDSSTNGITGIQEPIRIVFRNGRITEISGGEEASRLKEIIDSADDSAHRFCEIGIGTNSWQPVSGMMGEDKKVAGGIHIAVGCNTGAALWGDIPGTVHLDCVAVKQQPTLEVDGEVVVRGGKLVG